MVWQAKVLAAKQTEFDPQEPHSGRGESSLTNCFLTFTHVLWDGHTLTLKKIQLLVPYQFAHVLVPSRSGATRWEPQGWRGGEL